MVILVDMVVGSTPILSDDDDVESWSIVDTLASVVVVVIIAGGNVLIWHVGTSHAIVWTFSGHLIKMKKVFQTFFQT